MIRISQGKREDETHRHYYTHQKKVPLIKDNNKFKDYHAILGTLKAHIAVTAISIAIRKLYETFRANKFVFLDVTNPDGLFNCENRFVVLNDCRIRQETKC